MEFKPERVTVASYLRGPETLRPTELVWGVVREAAAPHPDHQTIVLNIATRLRAEARRRRAGAAYVSPIDVILDERRGLVVQPDVAFVSTARASLVTDRIWGAPDMVVEVLSWATARRDRTRKLGWYARYGVRECWMVDPIAHQIEVIGCASRPRAHRVFRMGARVRSAVLPTLRFAVAEAFSDVSDQRE